MLTGFSGALSAMAAQSFSGSYFFAFPPLALFMSAARSEERRVGKECRSLCDWSSDVCSSDLNADGILRRAVGDGRAELFRVVLLCLSALGSFHVGGEIGRASCRERV